MITLITGSPGSGKTLYCVDKLVRPIIGTNVAGVDENGDPATYDRRVYSNINGLLLDHELVDGPWLENLYSNKQPGAFVVFDEVQRVWPNRPVGSKKPAAVEYLETHRHDGIDLVLMTQNPQLLDPAVRKLVGRHLHMRRIGGLGASVVYEWDACSDTLRFKSAFTKILYKYSRSAYQLYKSARVHTKQKRKLPFAVWLLLFAAIGALVMWPQFVGRLKSRALVSSKASVIVSSTPSDASRSVPVSSLSPSAAGAAPMSAKDYLASLQPRLNGLPYTAPRYDSLTVPTRVPYPAACITSKLQGCKCYAQDGTFMLLAFDVCARIVQHGFFIDFDPDKSALSSQALVVSSDSQQWSDLRPGRLGRTGEVVGAGGITAGDIARLSRASTGMNVRAHGGGRISPVDGSAAATAVARLD